MEQNCVTTGDVVYHLHLSLRVGWGGAVNLACMVSNGCTNRYFNEFLAYKVCIWDGIVLLTFVGINKVL